MKRLAIACSAIFCLSFHANAQTYLSCDFNEDIPSDFTLIDNDGLTPSADVQKLGFAVGTPWVATTPNGETGKAAAATSWYDPAGTSDDWLITPAFTVSDNNAVLSWRARSRNKRIHDSYVVYVSTTGGKTIADFDTTAPLFTTDGESNSWTSHSVSLDAYKGKTISIAFVENSTNKDVLYIDDLLAAVSSDITVKSALKPYTAYLKTPLTATVTNVGTETMAGFDVSYAIGDGQTQTKHFVDTLAGGASVDVTLDTITLSKLQTIPYTITAKAGSSKFIYDGTLTCYQRKAVAEELTGTWCSWCVRGIVKMLSWQRNRQDDCIGIAVHSGDVMENSYLSGLSNIANWEGLPSGVVARQYDGVDPGYFDVAADKVLASEPVYCAIDLNAQTDKATRTISSTASFTFAADAQGADYKLAYVLTENNVHHPGDSEYSQYNAAYSNAGTTKGGEMGGWELLPVAVSADDMWYHDVARYYDGDFLGNAGLLPEAIAAGKTIQVERTIVIPDSCADDLDNCELIVMLVSAADNHIVNAERVKLNPDAPELVDVAARYLQLNGIETVRPEGTRQQAIYNINGVRLQHPQRGINIIRYSDGKSRKVIVR